MKLLESKQQLMVCIFNYKWPRNISKSKTIYTTSRSRGQQKLNFQTVCRQSSKNTFHYLQNFPELSKIVFDLEMFTHFFGRFIFIYFFID